MKPSQKNTNGGGQVEKMIVKHKKNRAKRLHTRKFHFNFAISFKIAPQGTL